ncbi:MAG: GGDEF domain-containing protein [Acidobacteriota bacterium]
MTDNNDTHSFSDQTIEVRMTDLRGSQSEAGGTSYHFTLTVIEGRDFGCVFQLDKAETVLGRSEEADIRLDDAKASRRHLLIAKQQLGVPENAARTIAIDLDSKNGTYVNGERITQIELRNADKVQLGDTILKFEVKDRLDLSYHERLYQQATRDALTGLWNRSHAQEEMEKFLSLAKRYNRLFSLLLLDIDFFKSVNDSYGHDIGDVVLRSTAQAIDTQLRAHDIAARYGGEEFIVLLPETDIGGAVIAAERLRQAIEGIDFLPLGCPRRVTISIGVAQYPICGRSVEELIKQADDALYRAKQTGRNRVCIATPLLE